MAKIEYEAKISGHEAPFKWQIIKVVDGAPRPVTTGRTGEAGTYREAMFAASDAAHDLEYERKHMETVRNEPLFAVDTDVELPNPLAMAD